jgi:hypothetical protein
MGVYGWRILGDDVEVQGIIRGHSFSKVDKDWDLSLEPLPAFASFLRNPTAPAPNKSGRMTCEIEPVQLPSTLGEGEVVESAFFAPLVGQTVTATGVWAVDCSHLWDGRTGLPVPHCRRGKTEIHPLASLLVESPAQGATKTIEVFVFSDVDKKLARVPHGAENWHRTFRIAFPPRPTAQATPIFTIRPDRLVNLTRSATWRIVQSGIRIHLEGDIQSGTPDEGNGFYHAIIDLGYS